MNSIGLLAFKPDLAAVDMVSGGVGTGRGWFGGVGGDGGHLGVTGVVESSSDESGTRGQGS